MLLRGVAGVIIGIAYGFLVSGVVFLLTRTEGGQPNAGMIMLDPVALAWLATVLSGLIVGACAVVLGVIVGMARLDKAKAGTIGFFIGLVLLGLIYMSSWSTPRLPNSLDEWIDLFVAIAILPIGLGAIGMVVAMVAGKLHERQTRFTDLVNPVE